MRYGVVLLVVSMGLASGCSGSNSTAKHTWPMSEDQLAKLKAMPRAERDQWFANLELPQYVAHRASGPIVIDGDLSDAAWKNAPAVDLREGALGGKVRYGTRVKMLWDDDAIYLAYVCDDPDIHAPLTAHDAPLWKYDLVETFIDPNADGKSYMELHVAPNGATADVLWADFRPGDDWFADLMWKRFVDGTSTKAFEAKGMQAAVKLDGTLNNPADTDRGYTVEWRIPYSAMINVKPDVQAGREKIDCTLYQHLPVPKPTVGTVWRMNFNRCDDSIKVKEKNAKGKEVDVPEYSAWGPTTGSNHMPFLFGRVKFAK